MTHTERPATITALIADVEAVRGTVRWEGERKFSVLVPSRTRNATTGEVFERPLNIGTVGWYVRDGRAHIGGGIADVRRAVANLREGKGPLAPRRTAAGNYRGRDRAGRFTA